MSSFSPLHSRYPPSGVQPLPKCLAIAFCALSGCGFGVCWGSEAGAAGKSAEAIAELQRLGVENPNLRGLAHELGITYYKAGDYLKAIDAFKKATQEDPGNKEAVQLLGLSNYLAGRPADAIPLLEKVQGWYPRANVDASYILGVCYIQTKDYPKARVAFARMFDVAPGFGGGLPVHGADAVAAGVRSDCRGVCAEGD